MRNRVLLTVTTLFTLAAFACASGESVTYLYLKASQLDQSGKLDEAFRVYNMVLTREKSPTLYIKIADLERRRGNLKNASDLLERAGKEYPENADIAFAYGAYCIENARLAESVNETKPSKETKSADEAKSAEKRDKWLNEAKKAFKTAAKLNPTEQNLVACAFAATELMDYDGASEIYKRLINELGKTEYYRPLGFLKIGEGKRSEGIADIKKAAELNDIQAFIDLASLAREDNDTAGAVNYLMKAREYEPEAVTINLYLADIYKDMKDFSSAIRFYIQASENTDWKTRIALLKQVGGMAFENKNFNAAFDAYNVALLNDGDDPQLYYLTGYAALRGGRADEAFRIFDSGIKKFPNYAMLRKLSAQSLIVLKKPKEAIEVIEKIDEVERDREYYLILAGAYFEMPDRTKAISVIEKGLKENPNSVELYLVLAEQYEKEKKYEDCISALKKALDKDPDSASALNFLGYLYADLNRNLDEAELLLNRALTLDPYNYAYLDSKAWLFYRKGKYSDAYNLIQKAIEINADDPELLEHLKLIKKKLPSGKKK
ncbi:MAG: tetratricopeptide repeat protein [Deferribacteraceae bacterium]|jgi:tetratricopeptide (TPR) repeat protein|nr:tetratricopeptide repeat protein [Deferribacteraceae bacterium]